MQVEILRVKLANVRAALEKWASDTAQTKTDFQYRSTVAEQTLYAENVFVNRRKREWAAKA